MSDEPKARFSPKDLREGFLVDYGMRTWTVTNYKTVPYEGWPAKLWELEDGHDELVLEYEPEDGDTFRLARRIDVDEVILDGRSFRQVMRMQEGEDNEPPGTVRYEGTEYTLAEKDARVHEEARVREENKDRVNFLSRSRTDQVLLGICGGLANYWNVPPTLVRIGAVVGLLAPQFLGAFLGVGQLLCLPVGLLYAGVTVFMLARTPPPELLDHHWVYEADGRFVTLQRSSGAFGGVGEGSWTAWAGQEVEPYEFDNILPPGED
jgi:phage shock protein PspC (stress-responsive transcriptional regulator)